MQNTSAARSVRSAIILAGSHVCFSLFIQVGTYFSQLYGTAGAPTVAGFFAVFWRAQQQTLSVALFLFLMAYVLSPWRRARIFLWAALIPLHVFLAADQVFYSFFRDHVRLSLHEGGTGGLSIMFGSFLREITPLFYMDIGLMALLAVLTWWAYVAVQREQRRVHGASWGILPYFFLNLWYGSVQALPTVFQHPLVVLLSDALTLEGGASGPPPGGIFPDFDRPVKGAPYVSEEEMKNLGAFRDLVQTGTKRPNVVFIVLESVGARQILPLGDGHFDPKVTPHLASLEDHAAIFDSAYAIFPGTVRSHLAMNTGGHAITWGSVFEELLIPYEGPTLNRAFDDLGYATGIFSSGYLDFENMKSFYENLGYDRFFEPSSSSASVKKTHAVSTWGIDEAYTMDQAMTWAEARHRDGKPFFLQLLTISTHHPYETPDGFVGPYPGADGRKQRYLNVLSYNDHVLGEAVARFKKAGLWENTLLVVTGDHGEAFAEWHTDNLLHNQRLYDENVRGFMVFIDGSGRAQRVVSHRPVSLGDVARTMVSLAGAGDSDLPGADVFKDRDNRIVFFHKNTLPEQWGLRDGNYKFIVNKVGDKHPEIYDVARDPDEQENLISKLPDLASRYDGRVESWFLQTNKEFVAHLPGFHYTGGIGFENVDVTSAGPKVIGIGYRDAEDEFQDAADGVLRSDQKPAARVRWVAYDSKKNVVFDWRAPSGTSYRFKHAIEADWTVYTTGTVKLPRPLEPGRWTLAIKSGKRELLSRDFWVKK